MGHDYSKVAKYGKAPKPGRPLRKCDNPMLTMLSLERNRRSPKGLTPQKEEDYQEHIRLFRRYQEDLKVAKVMIREVFRNESEGLARAMQGVSSPDIRPIISHHVEAVISNSFITLPYNNIPRGEQPVERGYPMSLALAPAASTTEVQLLERAARFRSPDKELQQQSDCFRRFAVEALASTETEEAAEACFRLLADIRDKTTRTMAAEVLKRHACSLLKEKCQTIAKLSTDESITRLLALCKPGSRVKLPGFFQRWRYSPVIADIRAIAGPVTDSEGKTNREE